MQNFRTSLDLSRKAGNKEYEARNLHQIGRILTVQGNFEEALGYFLSATKLVPGEQNIIDLADINISLGRLYEGQSVDRSRYYYSEALSEYTTANYQRGTGTAHYGLGRLSALQRNYPSAIDNFSRSLEIFSRIEAIGEQAECHRDLSAVYASLGEMDNAYNE
jgi:tetratricopeptide (TPR) repeat protein